MIVKSSTGQEYKISDKLTKDFRFLMAYKAMRSGDPEKSVDAAVDLVYLVFGDEANVQRFLRDIADENGDAPVDRVFAEVRGMLDQAAEAREIKNS